MKDSKAFLPTDSVSHLTMRSKAPYFPRATAVLLGNSQHAQFALKFMLLLTVNWFSTHTLSNEIIT